MQEKWEMSCWQGGGNSLPTIEDLHDAKAEPDIEKWKTIRANTQKEFVKYWKNINPKNKRQLVQFSSRACTFYTYNYVLEPFSTKELRQAYEMYMDQNIIHSKTKLGFFILGQFNSLPKIIEKAMFPKHIQSFNDLTKLNFGPELFSALTNFANAIDQYQKYNANWQDYIPLEIVLQKRSLVPANIKTETYRSWNYKKVQYENSIYYSYHEQEQPWNFIGLVKRETKHRMDVKWTNSPWHKEIHLEQKLLGNR